MKVISYIVAFFLIFFSFQTYLADTLNNKGKKPIPMAGPNCHIVKSSISNDSGNTYKINNNNLIKSASVPDAVRFNGKNLIYFVNGDFDNHSIFVYEILGDGDDTREIGPITLNGEIIKDAVDPDVMITDDGKIRLYYYVGLFTKPVVGNIKPNKFYSAISSDGVNFIIEGVVAELDDATDPTSIKVNDNLYLLALAESSKQRIAIYQSKDGRSFQELSNLEGGIPELTLSEEGYPELLFQDAEGIVKMHSKDNGKSWKKIKSNILKGDSKGSASPSVLRLNATKRLMFYFKALDGCTTSPTAYLEDKNSLMPKNNSEMGEPPLGHGVEPNLHNSEMGEPPLGHGVEPNNKVN